SDRHWQIESRSLFFHVSGTQVDDDALVGRAKAVIADRWKNAVPRFANRGVRQADNNDLAVAAGRDVHLDIDQIRFDAINSSTPCFEKHYCCGGIWGGAK